MVARSVVWKTWCLPDDVLPREEQGITDGRKITVTETGTGAGTGGKMSTRMSTRVVIELRTGAGTGAGTKVMIRVQGR